jgi:lysine decarboxylase/arginine decarboxylase
VDHPLPPSALHCGADLVVHSLQKSAAALAQTAVLWLQGERRGSRARGTQPGLAADHQPQCAAAGLLRSSPSTLASALGTPATAAASACRPEQLARTVRRERPASADNRGPAAPGPAHGPGRHQRPGCRRLASAPGAGGGTAGTSNTHLLPGAGTPARPGRRTCARHWQNLLRPSPIALLCRRFEAPPLPLVTHHSAATKPGVDSGASPGGVEGRGGMHRG